MKNYPWAIDDRTVRYGLGAIKGSGQGAVEAGDEVVDLRHARRRDDLAGTLGVGPAGAALRPFLETDLDRRHDRVGEEQAHQPEQHPEQQLRGEDQRRGKVDRAPGDAGGLFFSTRLPANRAACSA